VLSTPGRGTSVVLTLPLPARAQPIEAEARPEMATLH
jgi:hypothetical protein